MALPTLDAQPAGFAYPTGFRLALLMISIFLGMFLVALVRSPEQEPSGGMSVHAHADQPRSQDKLIIAAAIPQITNDFSSTNDIGWYGTAYLLTNCAFLLVFGKIYTFLDIKATFLTAVMLFEVGSAICGAAPNSIAFIIGRAIAGLGAGGVQSGVVRFPLSSSKPTRDQLSFCLFCAAPSSWPALLTPWCAISLSSLSTLFRYTSGPSTRASSAPCMGSRRCSARWSAAPSPRMSLGGGAFTSISP
jgi:MFS family permease